MTRGDILGHGIYAHGNIGKQNTFVSIFKSIVFYEYVLINKTSYCFKYIYDLRCIFSDIHVM